MTATFHVSHTVHFENQRLFVLQGKILQGTVRPGMILSIPFNPTVHMTAPMHGVESFAGSSDAPTGITISYADDTELAFWRGLNISDEVLEITDLSATDHGSPAA